MKGIISAEDNTNDTICDMSSLYEKIGAKPARLYIKLAGEYMESDGQPDRLYYSDVEFTEKELDEIDWVNYEEE